VGGVWAQALDGRGSDPIQPGLLLLIGTPIARAGFSLFAFARQYDALYAAVTAIVPGVLLHTPAGRAG
jgi:uncharacterized membrane protein